MKRICARCAFDLPFSWLSAVASATGKLRASLVLSSDFGSHFFGLPLTGQLFWRQPPGIYLDCCSHVLACTLETAATHILIRTQFSLPIRQKYFTLSSGGSRSGLGIFEGGKGK